MSTTRILLGAVIGAIIVTTAFLIFDALRQPQDDAAQPATSTLDSGDPTTTTSIPAIPWINPSEIVFASTILVPTSFTVDRGFAELEYELHSLSPLSGIEVHDHPEPHVVVYPERWELETRSGTSVLVDVNEGATKVRFAVDDDATVDDVRQIRLTGWRAAAPLEEQLTVPLETGTTVVYAGGTTITVDTVLEQKTSTIVQVDVDHPESEWDTIFATPADPGWRVSGRQDGGLQFIWEGDDPPGEIVLVQRTPTWVPLASDTVVWEGEPA